MTEATQNRHDWTVRGMDCASCAAKITRALEGLKGVDDVQVNVMAERLSATLTSGGAGADLVEATVRKLGYDIGPKAVPGVGGLPQKASVQSGGQDHDHDHDHDAGHGQPGHSHGSDPADRDKS